VKPSTPASRRRAAAFLLLFLLPPVAGAATQESPRWRPEDRTVLTAFHLITGMARDDQRLYAASPGGLQILDLFSERWELPSTATEGFPAIGGSGGVAYDSFNRAVFLGTLEGELYRFEVDLRRWTREPSPGVGPILRLVAFQERGEDGLYLLSPAGWFRYSRFSPFPSPIPGGRPPPGLLGEDASPEVRLGRLDPAFEALQGTLLREGGRRWPLTDFTPARSQGVFWLGSAGGGLYRYDSRIGTAEPLAFGLLSAGSAALGRAGSRIWFGGDGAGPRRGVAVGGDDLQGWRHFDEVSGSGAPGARVEDILLEEDGSGWFAASDGLRRMAGERWARIPGPAGDRGVRRVARTSDGVVWGASPQGLLRVDPGGVGSRLLPGAPLSAVVASGDTVWAGGEEGVQGMTAGGALPTFLPGSPSPRGTVDLALVGGELWAATSDALWRRGPAGWEGPLREVALSLGTLSRLRTGEDGALWVGGRGGAGRLDGSSGGWTLFLVGEDLPAGPVEDILPVGGERVYLATPVGVVRMAWTRRR